MVCLFPAVLSTLLFGVIYLFIIVTTECDTYHTTYTYTHHSPRVTGPPPHHYDSTHHSPVTPPPHCDVVGVPYTHSLQICSTHSITVGYHIYLHSRWVLPGVGPSHSYTLLLMGCYLYHSDAFLLWWRPVTIAPLRYICYYVRFW